VLRTISTRDEVLLDQIRAVVVVYFGLDVFCQFEARVLEFDAVFSIECTYTVYTYSPELSRGRGCILNSGTLASNRQNTASPKYDISLISQFLISDFNLQALLSTACI
jgi:hypothetical protein